jgi:hypothetical protein
MAGTLSEHASVLHWKGKKLSVSFCFKDSWQNPLEEISNIKNASLYCNSFSFSCSYSAPFKLVCLQFPILHFSPSDISNKYNCATATSGWYGDFPVHLLIWNQSTHISASWPTEFGCLSEMFCIVPFYSTPKQYLKHRLIQRAQTSCLQMPNMSREFRRTKNYNVSSPTHLVKFDMVSPIPTLFSF